MKRWIKILAAVMVLLLCFGTLSACHNKSGTKIVFTTGFGKDEIFRIEDESCKMAEMMVYLTATQNQYESVYGEEIWETSVNGVTLEENIKETVLAKIAQIKTMYLLAQSKGVGLSEEENKTIKKAANEYFQSLNKTEVSLMGVTLETIQNLYYQYAMADKVYQEIIQDINPEISDDEARTITVQYILLKTNTTDSTGKKNEYSTQTKTQIYEKACEIRELAASGDSDFEQLAMQYSEDDNITVSFGKGKMDPIIEETAFLLETGEVSEVVEYGAGYYIIKCISTFNREETDSNKLKIVEQRRKEVFGQEYNEFVKTLIRALNEKLWESVSLIHDEQVTTSDFFSVYKKYFPE